jgi:hypothetical protein
MIKVASIFRSDFFYFSVGYLILGYDLFKKHGDETIDRIIGIRGRKFCFGPI